MERYKKKINMISNTGRKIKKEGWVEEGRKITKKKKQEERNKNKKLYQMPL